MSMRVDLRQGATMRQTLAPHMRQGLRMLAMSLPELREELYAELARNPVIDDVEQTLERNTTSEVERAVEAREKADDSDYVDYDDTPEAPYNADADALERRQRFFDLQTKTESLEEHLRSQFGMYGLEGAEATVAEYIVGLLDANGYFRGSVPDIVMVTGESAEKVDAVRRTVMRMDPPGCAATTPRECLLAQVEKLGDNPFAADVRELVDLHLDDLAAGRTQKILDEMGMTQERLDDVVDELRTLEPHPGRAYATSSPDERYVRPEVHAVKVNGRWTARVDDRSLPDIRISPRYEKMLLDPKLPKETKDFIRERIASVHEIVDAVEHRQETVTAIAQAIFDAQPGFFEEGLRGLRPLTMQEIADKVGVHSTTVSRTVNDKYASTPRGTVELRKFFSSGITADDGTEVSKTDVKERLREIIEGEDPSAPYSDEKLSELLKAAGFPIARRTVNKYRVELGIPGAGDRRSK